MLLVSVLAAPMPGEPETARFKAAFDRGELEFQNGDFGAAIANFLEADRARPTPEVAFDLAKCFEKQGDEAYATYYYRLYMRRAPNATDTLDVAQRVGKVLTRLEAEGRGFLELDAPRAQTVTLAGRRYPSPPVAAFLAPGTWDVTGTFPSGVKKMSVQILVGRITTTHFEPNPPPLLTVEAALTAEAVSAGETSGPTVRPLRVASFVVFGLGLAALAAGAGLAVSSAADATAAQDKTHTFAQASQLAQSANGKALGADILFGAGGAVALTGALLFVFSLPEPGMPAPEATR